MELLELVILLLIAVLISSVLDEALPLFSLPLLQIVLGVAIAIFMPNLANVQVDANVFLLLFIAPLLFNETQHVDKLALWRNKAPILSLAIGLVIVCVLAVGFVLHWVQPSIGLAAAFALGAALGPTDAAAVVALGKDVKLTPRQSALLSGEALINDASGVVSFQFAIAAAVTGAFSAVDAGVSFLWLFFGGIVVGLAIGAVMRGIKRVLRVTGLDNTTSTVVLEVLAPFILYLVAEHFTVSGILAVVAGGLLMNMGPSKASAAMAKANIVSNSVWEVLVFIINGFLFVMLGMQLPGGISPTWEDVRFSTATLIGLIFLLTFVITAVRFVWMLVLECITKPQQEISAAQTGTIVLSTHHSMNPSIDPFTDPAERQRILEEAEAERLKAMATAPDYSFKDKCVNALVTTLAGPKGAVTMSIIMTIPYVTSSGASFPFRNMLVFLASGVILCTLILANFLLPVLAPAEESAEDHAQIKAAQIKILRQVVSQLAEDKTPQNEKATQLVIRRYRERLRRLRASEATADSIRALRLEVLGQQQEVVHYAIVSGQVDKKVGQDFADRLKRMRKSVSRRRYVLSTGRPTARAHGATTATPKLSEALGYGQAGGMTADELESMRYLIVMTEKQAIDHLEMRCKSDNAEIANSAALLLIEHKTALANFEDKYRQSTTAIFDTDPNPLGGLSGVLHAERNAENLKVKEVMAEGYRLELEKIQEFRENGQLSRKAARDLREEVYLLQMDASDALE